MASTIFRYRPRLKFISVFVRDKSVWTSENIMKSPCKDIIIPNLTIDQYMFRNLEKWATKTAVVCAVTNRGYTYEQVYKKSRTLAANLRKKFKVKNGDVVAVALPNVPEYPIITLGILAAGGIVTTVNPMYTEYEIQRQILQSDASLVITNEDIAATLKKGIQLAMKDIPIISLNMTQPLPEGTVSYKELVEDNHVDFTVLREVKRSYSDVAVLPYSSGTTGLPKGVQLTHGNIVSNCEQQNTEMRQYAFTTRNHQDNTLVILPMFHCYALAIQMFHKMSVGLKLVMLPMFQPDFFLDILLAHRINLLYIAPPIVLFLGSYPKVTAKHLEHATCVTSGAAPLPTADIQRIFEKANREFQFSQGYGLTEASPLVSLLPLGDKHYEDVGYAVPNVDLRIVDEELKNLGPNEVGELLARGPNIMKGYLNNPAATSEMFDGDWLRTGDLAKINENGLITICDRLKELIKVKGYQVPPAELENILKEHPAILDAAVIGIPDDLAGERPRAFVVLKQGEQASEKEIMNFVATKVAPYKKIKQISFLDSIPKSQSGKILRKNLKAEFC